VWLLIVPGVRLRVVWTGVVDTNPVSGVMVTTPEGGDESAGDHQAVRDTLSAMLRRITTHWARRLGIARALTRTLYFRHFNPYRAAGILAQHRHIRSLPAGHEGVIALDATTRMHLRAGTTDLAIFDQIFAMQDCAVPFALRASLIIDGGAHIGCAAVYYARRYRNARIVAIEAERGNYEMLKQNVASLPNIVPIHGALWSEGGKLAIADPGAQTWAFQVTESAEGDIPAFTIDDILAMSGQTEIGLLKLDIEGTEARVFAADCSAWLSRTHVINIELHDRLVTNCTGAFLAAIAPHGFSRRRRTQHNVVVARR